MARHPGARDLLDDAAVLDGLVLTHDMIAEGVHFLSGDPAGDVAWKLIAVNLSDLAAKGATPAGVLLGYALTADPEWEAAFLAGLGAALAAYDVPLLGGDTISLPVGAPRTLGLTAIGRTDGPAPARSGAMAGDALFVTGTIGDAGLGLAMARGDRTVDPTLLAAYRRPVPRIADGRALAPIVHAMMDVSDGLLLDAARMAEASGLAIAIDLDAVPLSKGFRATLGSGRDARLTAATAGDDYQLLFAAPADIALPVAATRIGGFASGGGLSLRDGADSVALPARLGYLHG